MDIERAIERACAKIPIEQIGIFAGQSVVASSGSVDPFGRDEERGRRAGGADVHTDGIR